MPKTPPELFAYLHSLGIAHTTVTHAAVFTAADEIEWKDAAPGLHCKNLFVENKEGRQWLVVMPAADRADMNAIGKQLGGGRLSFVKGDNMLPVLGVTPGSATPFALLNETARNVSVALDEQVPAAASLNVHPLINTASTIISGADLVKFLTAVGHPPLIITASKAEVAA